MQLLAFLPIIVSVCKNTAFYLGKILSLNLFFLHKIEPSINEHIPLPKSIKNGVAHPSNQLLQQAFPAYNAALTALSSCILSLSFVFYFCDQNKI